MTELVLLPGLLCDSDLWADQREALEKIANLTVVVFANHDTVEMMVDEVLEAAPDRFSLAALSMGGYVAMSLVRRAPERVERLALIDTTARPDDPSVSTRRRDLVALGSRQGIRAAAEAMLPQLVATPHIDDPDVRGRWLAMASRVGQEAFAKQQNAIIGREDARSWLPGIQIPTLVLHGEQDALTPPAVHSEIASLMPNARLRSLPDCGHLSPLEDPQGVLREMQGWLEWPTSPSASSAPSTAVASQ